MLKSSPKAIALYLQILVNSIFRQFLPSHPIRNSNYDSAIFIEIYSIHYLLKTFMSVVSFYHFDRCVPDQ